MNNRNVGFTIVAAAAIALLFGTAPIFAKGIRSAAAVSNTAQFNTQPGQQPTQSNKAQSFTGTIQKSSSGSYELNSGGMTYQLSDQSQASQFVGKQVTVTGTLNSSSNTIQVKQIKPSSGQ